MLKCAESVSYNVGELNQFDVVYSRCGWANEEQEVRTVILSINFCVVQLLLTLEVHHTWSSVSLIMKIFGWVAKHFYLKEKKLSTFEWLHHKSDTTMKGSAQCNTDTYRFQSVMQKEACQSNTHAPNRIFFIHLLHNSFCSAIVVWKVINTRIDG